MATALKRAGAGWGLNLLALLLGGAIGVYGVIALTDHLSAPQSQAQTEQPSEGDEPSAPRVAKAAPTRMDPRRGGLEVGLGEWALTPEADVIRPGRVTFVISNHGTMAHGFEIKLEGDSSGHGSGDLLKAESRLLQPGESTRLTVSLDAAFYEIECLVDGHDDMGMQGVLEVRKGAPLVKTERESRPGRVSIRDFSFSPDSIHVPVGTELTWRNDDPTQHTVTSLDGDFGSDALDPGTSFTHLFNEAGTFLYRCSIHPDMEGEVTVE